jgi:DNA gyrase inhibitor GyrI
MLSVNKSWFATSLQDEAFFNATISRYAERFAWASNRRDTVESMVPRMKAIEILNERISKKQGEISDGTIATGDYAIQSVSKC